MSRSAAAWVSGLGILVIAYAVVFVAVQAEVNLPAGAWILLKITLAWNCAVCLAAALAASAVTRGSPRSR